MQQVEVATVEIGDAEGLLVHRGVAPTRRAHDLPVKVKILDGADGPLATAPDPGFESMNQTEFILSGSESTPSGRIGDRNSPTPLPG